MPIPGIPSREEIPPHVQSWPSLGPFPLIPPLIPWKQIPIPPARDLWECPVPLESPFLQAEPLSQLPLGIPAPSQLHSPSCPNNRSGAASLSRKFPTFSEPLELKSTEFRRMLPL